MSAPAISPATDADRRGERTRQAIRTAFLHLLAERGFARTTVADVVARANVGRSTFYEQYRTRHDLFCRSVAAPLGLLASIVGCRQPPPALIPLLHHFRQNQSLAKELFLTPSTRLLMSRTLAGLIEARLQEMLSCQPAAPLLPRALIAAQLAESQLCLVQSWSVGAASCPADQIAIALCAASQALTNALLGKAE